MCLILYNLIFEHVEIEEAHIFIYLQINSIFITKFNMLFFLKNLWLLFSTILHHWLFEFIKLWLVNLSVELIWFIF